MVNCARESNLSDESTGTSLPEVFMRSKIMCVFILGQLSAFANHASIQALQADTGSALTAREADALVGFHNKARSEVGVAAVRWSPALAKFAQEWADEVATTGKLLHRPLEG